MLVYGDPQFECKGSDALDLLRLAVARTTVDDIDAVRRLLIQLGQVEQAVIDLAASDRDTTEIERILDIAAELFCGVVRGYITYRSVEEISEALDQLHLPDRALTMKVPEGFEFYSLYPEQFISSALRWHEDHIETTIRKIAIIGIRSIGTTLSAVVAATLRHEGWSVERRTVRPRGHPFNRRIEKPMSLQAPWAIVVDEGPGLSGSSMAAVAEGLARRGIDRAKISFLPGHGNEPGSAASESIRKWWKNTRRYFTSLDTINWSGHDLRSALLRKSAELLGKPFLQCRDFSAGAWREAVCEPYQQLTPSFVPFERTKYLCMAEDGSALLWKFNGLGSSFGTATDQRSRALAKFVVAPISFCHGFSVTPWIEGQQLKREDLSAGLIAHLASYLLASARAPLSAEQHRGGIERLREMTFWNTKNVLGEEAAQAATAKVESARNCHSLPRYGDGHIAPWEWIRTADGDILKTDWSGHDVDHTLVGEQSLLWDIAGLCVEWRFAAVSEQLLLRNLTEANIDIPPDALLFFKSAYAAFQMGKSALCESIVVNAQEKNPLAEAKRFYCHQLTESLHG